MPNGRYKLFGINFVIPGRETDPEHPGSITVEKDLTVITTVSAVLQNMSLTTVEEEHTLCSMDVTYPNREIQTFIQITNKELMNARQKSSSKRTMYELSKGGHPYKQPEAGIYLLEFSGESSTYISNDAKLHIIPSVKIVVDGKKVVDLRFQSSMGQMTVKRNWVFNF